VACDDFDLRAIVRLRGYQKNTNPLRRSRVLQIARGGLPFGAGESALDGGHIVEMQDRGQMNAGGSGRRRHRAFVDFVFPQARNLFGERHVFVEIVLVERHRIARRLVHDDEPSHDSSCYRHYSAALRTRASGS
jgi:hypothetical protein